MTLEIKFENGNEYTWKCQPLKDVDSSNIDMVGYDEEQNLLFICYKSKNTVERPMYVYDQVSQKEYDELLNAESKGKYVNSQIKPNHEYFKTIYYSTK